MRKLIILCTWLLCSVSGFSNDTTGLPKTQMPVADAGSRLKIDSLPAKDSNAIEVKGNDTVFVKPETEASFPGEVSHGECILKKT
jgi:hypothetical protein